MAFPAFRSSSVVNTTVDDSSFVFTKPAGLAEGDYMLVGVRIQAGSSLTISAPAGWNALYSNPGSTAAYYFDKIASSGDAAASNFTFTISGTADSRVGYMAAFSGASSRQDFDLQNRVSGAVSGTVSVAPLTTESLVITTLLTRDGDLSATLTASASTITPSTTMTERVDEGYRDGASDGISAFMYSGENTGTAGITAFSFTTSEAITGSTDGGVIILNGVQNATADISHLAITPTVESVTGSNTATATIDHIALEPTVESLTAASTSDGTQWTEPTRQTTDWTNKQK